MKKNLTVRSVLFNSFIVVIFAVCGTSVNNKSEICSSLDSRMFLRTNHFAQSQIEYNSHPIFLPKNPHFDQESHPMVISPFSKSEE